MSAPPVRIESKAWTDTRYTTLALELGLPASESDTALIRCAAVWRWQTEHYTDTAPTYVVTAAVVNGALKSLDGARAMVAADLAQLEPDGRLRIRGGLDDKGASRISWLWDDRQQKRTAGKASADRRKAAGDPRGKRGTFGDLTNGRPTGDQRATNETPPETERSTERPPSSPDSGLWSPDPESLSSAGAREPGATAVHPFAPLEPLVSLAIDQLNAARTALDPDAPPIAALGDAAGVRSLLDRLRPIPEGDREPTLRRAIAVLVETVRAKGWPVGELRLGQLAGERAWSQWLAGTVKNIRETAERARSEAAKPSRFERATPAQLPAVGKGPAPVVVPAEERAAAAELLAESKRALGIVEDEPEEEDDDPSEALAELKQRLAAGAGGTR